MQASKKVKAHVIRKRKRQEGHVSRKRKRRSPVTRWSTLDINLQEELRDKRVRRNGVFVVCDATIKQHKTRKNIEILRHYVHAWFGMRHNFYLNLWHTLTRTLLCKKRFLESRDLKIMTQLKPSPMRCWVCTQILDDCLCGQQQKWSILTLPCPPDNLYLQFSCNLLKLDECRLIMDSSNTNKNNMAYIHSKMTTCWYQNYIKEVLSWFLPRVLGFIVFEFCLDELQYFPVPEIIRRFFDDECILKRRQRWRWLTYFFEKTKS